MSKKNGAGNKLESERSAITIEVAGRLFLEHGFEHVSLAMIVAKTGGSYRDLYKIFGGKEELFVRVVTSVVEDVLLPLKKITHSVAHTSDSLEEALTQIGHSVLSMLLSRRVLALHRLIINEARRFPALGEAFYDLGPSSANEAVASLLTARSAQDRLAIGDASLTAAIFLDMLVNNLQLRALTGGTVSPKDVDERVREATRIFLDGVRRKPRR